MTDRFVLNVRAAEPPYEILGCLPVPRDAALGQADCVTFAKKYHWSEMSRLPPEDQAFKTVALRVHRFVTRVFPDRDLFNREYAFKVPRAEWSDLKDAIL
jgi:hypothetical protein